MRARLIALASLRWCLAQTPLFLAAIILACGSVKCRSVSASVWLISFILFVQK